MAEERSAAWLEGFRLGVADAARGWTRAICGSGPETLEKAEGYWAGRKAAERQHQPKREAGLVTADREASAVDWHTVAAPIAAVQGWRPQAVPAQPDPYRADWAGAGFSQPGPAGPSVPSRELYRAALKDALAHTADRDGCGECDGA